MMDRLDYELGWVEFWMCIFCIPVSVIFLPWFVTLPTIGLLMVAAYLTLLDITSFRIKKEMEERGTYKKRVREVI